MMTDKTRLDAMREHSEVLIGHITNCPQLDPDGIKVSVSRQACDESADLMRALLDLVTAYDAEHNAVSVLVRCRTTGELLEARRDVLAAHELSAKAREDFENG